MQTMIDALVECYRAWKIYPHSFDCPRFSDSSSSCLETAKRIPTFTMEKFTQAKASYVGSGYQAHLGGCRLLFLSLDPGNGELDDRGQLIRLNPEERTPAGVREQTMAGLEESGVKGEWTHWYWTHMLALQILSKFHTDLKEIRCGLRDWKGVSKQARGKLRAVTPLIAHVNVTKCSIGQTAQAPQGLYLNCRAILSAELPILKPDVIVTQGKKAAEALGWMLHTPCPGPGRWTQIKLGSETAGSDDVLWIQTTHPRHPRFFTEGGPGWKHYVDVVSDFMRIKNVMLRQGDGDCGKQP